MITYKELSIAESDSAQIQFIITDIITDDVANGGELNESIQNQYGLGQTTPLDATGTAGKIKAAITLPCPPTMSFKFSAQWEKVSLGFLGAEIGKVNISDTVKALRDSATTGDTTARDNILKVAAAAVGDSLVNMFKNTSVFQGLSTGKRANFGTKETTKQLFREMSPRSFSFSFVLSPKNSKEAEDLKIACKVFRFFMHPFNAIDIINSLKIVNYPAVFDISYLNGYSKNVPMIKTCILSEYQESYGTDHNGVTVLSASGYPVQTKLDMQFTEISLMDRSDVYTDDAYQGDGVIIENAGDIFK